MINVMQKIGLPLKANWSTEAVTSHYCWTIKNLTVANAVSLANIQQQLVGFTCVFCTITHQMSLPAPHLLSQISADGGLLTQQ